MTPERLCWPILGLCWPIWGLCWGHVRPSWGYVGAMLPHLGQPPVGPCCGRCWTVGHPPRWFWAMLFSWLHLHSQNFAWKSSPQWPARHPLHFCKTISLKKLNPAGDGHTPDESLKAPTSGLRGSRRPFPRNKLSFRNYVSETTFQKLRFRNYVSETTLSSETTFQKLRFLQKLRFRNYAFFRNYSFFRNYVSETTFQQLRFRNYVSETTFQKRRFLQKLRFRNDVFFRNYVSETTFSSETTFQKLRFKKLHLLKISPFACPNLVEFREIAKEVMITNAYNYINFPALPAQILLKLEKLQKGWWLQTLTIT